MTKRVIKDKANMMRAKMGAAHLLLLTLLCGIPSIYTNSAAAAEPTNYKASESAIRQRAREYQTKALCLYNFVNFVEWPHEAFVHSDTLKLCLVGQTSFGGFLKTVEGTYVGDYPLQIIRSSDGEDEEIKAGCHILFVDFDQKKNLETFFQDLDHTFVLSVGDQPNFADEWGTVNIHRIKDGAQIEINLKKVFESNLRMSSDLLGIAKIVNFEEAMRASR